MTERLLFTCTVSDAHYKPFAHIGAKQPHPASRPIRPVYRHAPAIRTLSYPETMDMRSVPSDVEFLEVPTSKSSSENQEQNGLCSIRPLGSNRAEVYRAKIHSTRRSITERLNAEPEHSLTRSRNGPGPRARASNSIPQFPDRTGFPLWV